MSKTRYSYQFIQFLKATLASIFVIMSLNGISQEDCICNDSDKITICYFSADEICPPGTECRYTLDGAFMRNSLTKKLQNPALFGPDGISKCVIELEPIGKVDSVGFLEESKCNIMFIGAFSQFFGVSLEQTAIPDSDLNNIKEWSAKCPNNLVIVTQEEAEPWGYRSLNLNINPNVPDPMFSDFSIFNGVFGQVSQFNQGGAFQGVFDMFPTTGFSILARDFNNQPTVVLDSFTNDIILGDVGILCSTAGPLSTGDDIIFDNDVLACNLFDLGCQIASNTYTDFVDLCDGDTHTTPGGQVVSVKGVYVDTLLTINNCDSLVYSVIDVFESFETSFVNSSCDSDDFEVTIGNTLYNKTNKTGTEFLLTYQGCDSIINVELFYAQTDTTYLNESICEGDVFMVGNFEFSETGYSEVILEDNGLCDSIVYLDLISNDNYDTLILVDLCFGEVHTVSNGTVLSSNVAYAEFYFDQYACDSVITTVVTVYEEYDLDEVYLGCKGDGYSLNVGGSLYDEANPTGIEYLISARGCDSSITVLFQYATVDTTYLDIELCPYESAEVGGVEYVGNLYEEIRLSASSNCDSVIFLDLETYPSTGVYLESLYDVDLNRDFAFEVEEIMGAEYEWISDGELSCNTCFDPKLVFKALPTYVQMNYMDTFNCVYSSQAELQYSCTPFFSNVLKVNSQIEENRYFKVEALCSFNQYSMKIYDRWGAQVFLSNDQSESWDGSYNGKTSAQGVYVYVMDYDLRGINHQFVGSVMLMH